MKLLLIKYRAFIYKENCNVFSEYKKKIKGQCINIVFREKIQNVKPKFIKCMPFP